MVLPAGEKAGYNGAIIYFSRNSKSRLEGVSTSSKRRE